MANTNCCIATQLHKLQLNLDLKALESGRKHWLAERHRRDFQQRIEFYYFIKRRPLYTLPMINFLTKLRSWDRLKMYCSIQTTLFYLKTMFAFFRKKRSSQGLSSKPNHERSIPMKPPIPPRMSLWISLQVLNKTFLDTNKHQLHAVVMCMHVTALKVTSGALWIGSPLI